MARRGKSGRERAEEASCKIKRPRDTAAVNNRTAVAGKQEPQSRTKQAFMRATSSAVAVAPFIVRGGIGGLGRGPGL